ncbi:hypothetical protein ACLOJK_036563 [Asimina triloba]
MNPCRSFPQTLKLQIVSAVVSTAAPIIEPAFDPAAHSSVLGPSVAAGTPFFGLHPALVRPDHAAPGPSVAATTPATDPVLHPSAKAAKVRQRLDPAISGSFVARHRSSVVHPAAAICPIACPPQI